MKKAAKKRKDAQKRDRTQERYPWNSLNVQLELHFCPSLQARFHLPAMVYEPFDMIYPKLHEKGAPKC